VGGGGGPNDVAAEGEFVSHGVPPFSVIDFGSAEKTNRGDTVIKVKN
jgi:hypothetical protein